MPLFVRDANGQNSPINGYSRSIDGVNEPGSFWGEAAPINEPPPLNNNYAPSYKWTFETGNLSQWANTHGDKPAIVNSGRNDFPFAARFRVHDATRAPWDKSTWANGDIPARRTEMVDGDPNHNGNIASGVEQWWAWSTKFPVGLISPNADAGWLVWIQWHHSGPTGKPPLWFNVANRSGQPAQVNLVTITDSYNMGTPPLGVWTDWKLYIKWHHDSTIGRLTVWRDGQIILENISATTVYAGQTNYVKQGLYGNRFSGASGSTTPEPEQTFEHCGLRWGPTEASITL